MARSPATPARMVVSVAVVCAVAAAGLALTYEVTRDRILAQNRAAQLAALKAGVPGGVEFEPASSAALSVAQQAAGDVPVYGVYEASAAGEVVGWGVEVGPRGYGGPIRMVVGLDRNGKVVGVSIVAMNETPGLGTQIVDREDFIPQFIGVQAEQADKDLKEVDLITGATKSSRGVRHGVEAAVAVYVKLVAEGEGVQ